MSSFQVSSDFGRIDLGYDPLIDSYFIQVRKPDSTGHLELCEWWGSGVANNGSNDLIHDPEIVTRRASGFASIPEDLAEVLRAEAMREPALVIVDRVTYFGTPTHEVWRQKCGVDLEAGKRIDVREHEIYSWSRQVALAILFDVLDHKLRARKLASDFGSLIESQLERRYWLLTEADIRSGIFTIEKSNNLRWIPSMLCYAGSSKTPELNPEAQLRRANDHNDQTQLL